MKVTIKSNIFNSAYLPYVSDYSKRYEVYYGGAGSGKSHFVIQKMIIKALSDHRKILVVRKVAATLRNSIFQLTKDILSDFHLLESCKINMTLLSIELPNGSVFLFTGLDDVEKIKSITGITDIVIEEASEIFQEDYQQLDLRMRSKAKNEQLICMFNPVSKANWTYTYFFEKEQIEDTLILRTTFKDNKFLSAAYIAAIEKLINTNKYYYEVYALGLFANLGKRVFENWKKEEFNIAEVKAKFHNTFGLDFGYINDNTAFVAAAVDQINKIIYIYDEFAQTGLLNNTIADMLKIKGYSKEVITADSSEQKSIEEIRRAGISRIKAAKKGPDSIIYGIQRLQQYRILIHPSCENCLVEFENYTWQKDRKTGEYIQKPVDEFNHNIDSLRYALEDLDPKKVRSMDKATLGL